MHLLIPLLLFVGLVYAPSLWVQWVLRRHAEPLPGCRWSGGELAEHLLLRQGVEGVTVRVTDRGDHYDSEKRSVGLREEHFHGRSLTALTVAAHEVGHAIQHAEGDRAHALRIRLLLRATSLDRALPWALGVMVVAALVVRVPAFFALVVVLYLISAGLRTMVHLVTLPVEWDASFNRALPMLEETGVLHPRDLPAAQSVLTAAALTYLAGSLRSLLRLRWWLRKAVLRV
jgi:Zn-dependent membrane protease YugP